MKTPAPESLSKNTFFCRTPPVAASENNILVTEHILMPSFAVMKVSQKNTRNYCKAILTIYWFIDMLPPHPNTNQEKA